MPPRKTKAAQAETPDYTTYVEKAATDLQSRFAAWIPDVTGYNPAAEKTKLKAFEEGVRLATALRMQFQASPENQEILAERKAAAAEKKAAPAAKKRGRAKAKAEEDVEEPDELDEDDEEAADDEEAEEVAPKPKARRGRAAKSAAAPAAKKRGRAKAAAGADAPF